MRKESYHKTVHNDTLSCLSFTTNNYGQVRNKLMGKENDKGVNKICGCFTLAYYQPVRMSHVKNKRL